MVYHAWERLRLTADGTVVDDSSLIRLIAAPVILIVDDDGGMQRMLTEIFALEGYRTETASDGREALARLRASGPYIVVLDLMMPYMKGDEVLVALKDLPDVRRQHWIILMSGRPKVYEVAMACGADGFLQKPFSVEELLTAVEEGLREHAHLPSTDLRN